MLPQSCTLKRITKPAQATAVIIACAHAGYCAEPALAVTPYIPSVRCHAAAVPSAMPSAQSSTCTMRIMPEFVSPYIISRMELVIRSPGTSIISAPIITA